ncbi:protein translocase subunit SecF [Pontibaca methylaminivorans]|uniref:Protein-export membrane protein SecF n=1 Tax=Pontibaca methylaminivorans TaxID=515897 RepID=A0A1R3X175_9RHOB|nr:protein translocase subunit SecF [Pontibaca methylaminivorans]SIT84678.1 protein translocase subunit secF [Pontibaca methylaminivorans]
MRLKLVPAETKFDFFRLGWFWLGLSILLVIGSIGSYGVRGLNYGIDFLGGTTIRTESAQTVDVGEYRAALSALNLGDVLISEVYDPSFGSDRNVAMVRIQSQDATAAVTPELIAEVEAALKEVAPDIRFVSVESVGPKVSGELIRTAILAVAGALGAILIYVWFRFEWQFGVGAVLALLHDVILTIGIFSVLQMKFDQTTIAALLTIVGYSINDTVVIFDRVRENARKYKKKPLRDLLNLSINETLARTVMTAFTTLLALFALFFLGGDVIRGFVFAMIWGVVVGTYSSVFVASAVVLRLGLKRDWTTPNKPSGNKFADIDA